MLKRMLLIALLYYGNGVYAQALKPGFDALEYEGTLRRSCYQVDPQFRGSTPKEKQYVRVFRGKEVGLHNRWDLWLNRDSTVMIVNLRGTTSDMDSWLENFYSAMIPATGSLKLDSNYTFNYKLASDPKAMVHVGWTIGLGSLAPEVMQKIREYYGKGIRQLVIEGHSQGGALSCLMTSYLRYQQMDGNLPADLVMKTYASAAPKAGNLYYAYDYDFITRGGWAFTVVNTADWVPETPVSIQTLADFNKLNPFANTSAQLKGQKRVVRTALGYVYKRLTKTPHKAQRTYEKYVGRMTYKQVKRYMPNLVQPRYSKSANYMRAGQQIILRPDEEYYKRFPDEGDNIFRHHIFEPYYYLVEKLYKADIAVAAGSNTGK